MAPARSLGWLGCAVVVAGTAVTVSAAPPADGTTQSATPALAPPEDSPSNEDWTPPALDLGALRLRPVADLHRGGALYQERCAVCHGAGGRGDGPAGRKMLPRPRNLTRGVYALRSTESGDLPTDADLFRTISRGIRGTGMPGWSGLTAADRWQLVNYIKSLSPRFTDEGAGEVVRIEPSPPPMSRALVTRGEAVYRAMKCDECHGPTGRGDGKAAAEMKNDLGERAWAFDMSRGYKLKGGTTPTDVFRTFHTGLDGTPMPSYQGQLSNGDSWALVYFCISLFADVE